MKTFCRYYNLETENEGEVKHLEGELERRLLQEKNIRALEGASVEEIAEDISNGGSKGIVVYDSGEFDVLYSKDWTIKEPVRQIVRKRLFKPNEVTPAKHGLYGVELVVKATPQDIIDLQNYLSTTDLNVREARVVNEATFSFSTYPVPKTASLHVAPLIRDFIKNKFPNVNGQFSNQDGETMFDDLPKKVGYVSEGIYGGPVEDVLRLRKSLRNSLYSFGCDIYQEGVSFQ